MSSSLFEQIQNTRLHRGGDLQGSGVDKVVVLAFTLVSLVGLAYLSQLAWNTECTQNMTEMELYATKASVVLLWASIALNVLAISYPVKNKMLRMGVIGLAVVSLVGIGYLTKFSWDEKCTKNMTEHQTNLARMSAIVLIIGIVGQIMKNGYDVNKMVESEFSVPF